MHHLAARRLAPVEDRSDLGVSDVEHVVQQERRALIRRQPLEHRQEGDGEIGGELEVAIRRRASVTIGSGSQGPTYASRSVLSRRSRSMASRVVAVTSHASGLSMPRLIRLMPADVGLLHDVLGVGARTEHAVGEAEEPAAQRFEDGRRHLGSSHPFILLHAKTRDRSSV